MEFINEIGLTFLNLKNAVSNDSLRPVMTGAYIDSENSVLVTTDSHVLTIYPIFISSTNRVSKIVNIDLFDFKKHKIKVDKKNINLIKYKLDEDEAKVIFKDEIIHSTNYIEGKFPNYDAVIPKYEPSELDNINLSLKVLERISKSIPPYFSLKRCNFKFYGYLKTVKFEVKQDDLSIKGILMTMREI